MNAVLEAGSQLAIPFLEKVGRIAQENVFSFDTMTKMMNTAFSMVTKVGLGAVAALTGLAFISPSVQAELAKMKRPLFEIGDELGSSLKPGFQKLNELLRDTAGWLKENTWFTDALGGAFSTVVNVAGNLGSKLAEIGETYVKPVIELGMSLKLGEKVEWLFNEFGFAILGALIGFKLGGPQGALILGGAGLIAGAGIKQAEIYEGSPGNAGWGNWQGTSRGAENINIFINGTQITADSIEVLQD